MKILKKIATVLGSALMIGATMGFAAAASYPAPFIQNGAANVGIVYGTGTGVDATDQTQGNLIMADLSTTLSEQATGGSSTVIGGDYVQLERSTDKFNLMNNMSSFYSKLDESELSTVLAEGVYTNDDHDDFDYEQDIVLGSGIQLKHFLDADFNDEKPIIGFDLSSDQHLLNYTLDFTPDNAQGADTSWSGIINSYLPLFGQEYYVLSMTNTTITLLNAAASGELSEGETTTITTADTSYEVSVAYIDTDSVKLTINGQTTDVLAAGETQKLSDGSYAGIKSVSFQGVTGGSSFVSFSIGNGELVLENTKEVEINNEKLSVKEYDVVGSDEIVSYTLTSWITTSGTDLDKIVLEWKLDEDSWIAPGTEMTLPGFETITLNMGGFVTDKSELTKLDGDSSKLTLSTTITDGDIALDILYLNSSSTGIAGLGKDATHQLVTSATKGGASTAVNINLNASLNNYFVATWISGDDAETYAYKITGSSVDETATNKTTLTNLVTGGEDIVIDAVNGYTDANGHITFTLAFAHENYPTKPYVTLNITANGGNVYCDRIVTAEGLQMRLPVSVNNNNETASALTDGQWNSNTTAVGRTSATAWTMNFTEEDKEETIAAGPSFTVAMGFSGTDGIEPATIAGKLGTSTMYETEDNSNVWEGYMPTDLATKLIHDRPSSGLNDLEITYFGTEAYGEVYVMEGGATLGGTTELGNVLYADTETSSHTGKNLIVVGGSCINSVAADLLGSSSAVCGPSFTTLTTVGTGEALIKSFNNGGKVALLVAGYNAADTVMATTYLLNEDVDTSVGTALKVTSTTEASAVAASA